MAFQGVKLAGTGSLWVTASVRCGQGQGEGVSVDRFLVERELVVRGVTRIAGVDEAGRGPLAGPVVAAAVVFPSAWIRDGIPDGLRGLNDSKALTERRRELFFEFLTASSEVRAGVSVVEAEEIDRRNILRATHLGMIRALALLEEPPQHVLIDGRDTLDVAYAQTAMVRGDSRSYSIAAASVLAKVTRDRLMLDHDRRWPAYGFAVHKGYPTPQHLEALRREGASPIHRRSFAPVADVMRVGELPFGGP